ncbi:MAG: glycosyltransferase family 1 protein [Betaproteobacteria bacterium]|uniref:Glycosyltransferase family 1 protein n=1 Tax=Candidatus Proximibacter danicus TaxID=2954365 RepID=A0A9D7JYA9_9PROT|nr:glycosyltransferase family 1 protein [Candidatus Proximibacter danicus]
MNPCKRLLLLIPDRETYYSTTAYSIVKAANQLGVDATFVGGLRTPEEHAKVVARYAPDVVFEFNQSRNEAHGAIPRQVRHICWVQDPRGGAGDGDLLANNPHFGGSDIIYTYGAAEKCNLDPAKYPDSFWGVLYYGVDPDFFHPDPKTPFLRNSSFCGYIPPLVPQMDDQPFLSLGNRHLTYGELTYYMVREKCADARLSPARLHELILDKINSHFGIAMSIEEFRATVGKMPALRRFDLDLPRLPDRERLVDAALPFGGLELFGPNTWLTWPKYRPYYRHMLNWRTDLADVYRSSIINLHNGLETISQPRSMEIMASGGLLFTHSPINVPDDPDFARLIPGVHYAEFPESAPDHAEIMIEHYLKHPDEARRIGLAGAEEMHASHLWRHRMTRIFADLSAL